MRHRTAVMLGLVLGCATALPASSLQDALAGWGGDWKGTYSDDGGGIGNLEFQFAADSAGAAAGKASFDTESGPTTAGLEDLRLTRDSVRASLRFDGMIARFRGSRDGSGRATGVYTLLSAEQGSTVGSGTWQVAREPAGDN